MFSRYYQSELTYLREIGREFAQQHPSVAGAFHERGGDPDVERLLEGFAFLTARIRERIDDAVPELVDSIASIVLPQMVRPIPACSIAQFSARGTSERGAHLIPAGSQIASPPVDGTRVIFQTTADVRMLPLSIKRAWLDESIARHPELRLECVSHSPALAHELESSGIRFYVKAPWPQAASIMEWLGAHVRESFLEMGDTRVSLGDKVVRLVGTEPDISMLPWPENAPDGLRLAQEYFVLEEKLLFFELRGFEGMASELSESFNIVFRFESPPPLPERLDPTTFRLHCTPIINLFETSGDPIEWDPTMHETLVRAAGINPLHAEIYEILDVSANMGQGRKHLDVDSFLDFAHLARPPSETAYYSFRRTQSPIDEAMDTYISVNSPIDQLPIFEGGEILSLDLMCTNRNLASELRPGDITAALPASPTIASFENITRVSRPARPALGHDRLWRLVSHLALDAASMTEATSLRKLLHHYAAATEIDARVYDANVRRIESIRGIRCAAETQLMGGAPVRGLSTEIELDEHAFVSGGDAYLFGCVLNWLFATEIPLNTFHRLEVLLHPSGRRFIWPARSGTNPIF